VHTQATVVHALTERAALHPPHWDIAGVARPSRNATVCWAAPIARPHPRGPYRLLGQIGETEFFRDFEATNEALRDIEGNGSPIVQLRIYRVDPYAPAAEIERQRQVGIWEASILRWLGNHPGLVAAGDPFFTEDEDIGVVLPFEEAPGLTLKSFLEQHGRLQPAEIAPRFGAAIGALGLAHSRGIVHRRITPDAFLCTADQPFKLADFGFSSNLHSDTPAIPRELFSHPHYSAPEVLDGASATPSSDVFSLGLVLAEALHGKVEFADSRRIALPAAILAADKPDPMTGLLERMLAARPADRLRDGYSVLEHLLAASNTTGTPAAAIGEVLFAPGTLVNQAYRIVARVGPPRTRTTYEALHVVSNTARNLRVYEADERLLERLRQAFVRLYALRHPALLRFNELDRVHDPPLAGPNGAPLYFLDLEHVGGVAAHRLAEAGGIGTMRAAMAGAALCDLLTYLAEHSTWHGSLDSDAVMIGQNDEVIAGRPPPCCPPAHEPSALRMLPLSGDATPT
jgi:serine/threonine protein kinase